MKADLLLTNAAEVITCVSSGDDPLGRVRGGAVAVAGEHILAVGTTDEILPTFKSAETTVLDCQGKVLAPGFVDSHTHVVFGGTRVHEYAAKMTRTRAEVQAMGIPTGIAASMQMTRAASDDELLESASARLWKMLSAGTTTVESKSGYGLSPEHEIRMLEVNQKLDNALPVDVLSTFLGAHAFPPEIPQDVYVNQIIHEMLPEVAARGLAVFSDVYIDEGYFNLAQTRRVLEASRKHGFKLKIHADQYSALGGSELAAELGVVSADHLNFTSPETMKKLANAGVVGTLMPLIDFAVQHPHPFDARAMLEHGMTLALATDICPGGWTESMQLVMQFACRAHGFSPEDAMLAATRGGALALDLHDRGTLAPGMLADIQVWDIPRFEDVIYRLGNNAVEVVIKRGRVINYE